MGPCFRTTRFTRLENRLKDKDLGDPRLSKDREVFKSAVVEETRVFVPCKEPVQRCVHLVAWRGRVDTHHQMRGGVG